ncbi:AI-2E family transporter [Streptomyces violaceusniger]|uniref:AI-2E family transporter n=1 Tax=Streptomyces violaceusniger TaxID=68280 RepID=A0A4D4KM82_STRVO|nr:AI-2E family transporter [Streptomyces violaceusniger]
MSSDSPPPPERPGGRGVRPRRGTAGGPAGRASRAVARARRSGSAALAAAVRRAGDERGRVHPGLRLAAAYAWRLVAIGVAVYLGFTVLGRFELVAIAVFLALVATALLRPLADLLARVFPRPLAVALAVFGTLFAVLGLLALVGSAAAAEAGRLVGELRGGIGRIERWLEGPPFHVRRGVLSGAHDKVTAFVSQHRAALISRALSSAGRVVEAGTAVFLALFCSIFFIHSGDRMWQWFRGQLPERARSPWDRAARAAWTTFAGYTRGIIVVAASNATLVGIALFLLRVPLALPLTLLVFFATFIPLIGSPIALAVATVVALAGRGPAIAGVVLLLIVAVGQFEGHVLHPLVMSWAVRLHPVVVAISVIAGSLVAGVVGAVVAVPMVSVAWSVTRALRGRPPGEA